jgi:hypothetical protein
MEQPNYPNPIIKIFHITVGGLHWFLYQTLPDTPDDRKYCEWLEKNWPGQYRFEYPKDISQEIKKEN